MIAQANEMDLRNSNYEDPDPIEGVKGSSILKCLEFDYIQDTPFEVMHCVFLGVTRKMIDYFYSKSTILSSEKRDQIEKRRERFLLPSKITRKIRSFTLRKHFKSMEYQHLLFFFSYFLFKDILDSNYFDNLMLLSQGVLRLFFDGFGPDELVYGNRLINKFLENLRNQSEVQDFMLYNVHGLAHLYDDRLRHGPLYHVSAYPYENQLQLFKKQFFSRNKRSASLEKRMKCERILTSLRADRQVIFSNEIKPRNVDDVSIEEKIRTCLPSEFLTQISYYEFFKYKHLNVSTQNNKKRSTVDYLIKTGASFWRVYAIFKADSSYVLAEKIDTVAINSRLQ